MKLAFAIVTIGFLAMVNGDCWWTGCQLHTWAVVGCGHYGRVQMGRQDCSGGYMYNCCTSGGAGGNGLGNSEPDYKGKYADCWWTGCQLNTWAVVGCDHYKMKTVNTERCSGGNKYHCCPIN